MTIVRPKWSVLVTFISGCAITCTIAGKMNARVLPLPVCAMPNTSRPMRATGQAYAWIGEGLTNFGFYKIESTR